MTLQVYFQEYVSFQNKLATGCCQINLITFGGSAPFGYLFSFFSIIELGLGLGSGIDPSKALISFSSSIG